MIDDDVLGRAVAALGRDVEVVASGLPGSLSGSGVHRVRAGGADAVLKVTTAGPGHSDARRELAFYRTLAGGLPVATPRLLGYADRDALTVILLSAHTPAPPARDWDRARWLAVVHDLAALHEAPPPADAHWRHTAWLRRILDAPPLAAARAYWSRTAAAEDVAPLLDAGASMAASMAAALDAVPMVFIHGDLHVDNLLHDLTLTGTSPLVWVDWQVAGIGSPAIDLAFLWLRANTDGADLPYDAMLSEYADRRGIDPSPMRRAVTAAEVALTVFGFPEYAGLRTQDERDRVTHRLRHLLPLPPR